MTRNSLSRPFFPLFERFFRVVFPVLTRFDDWRNNHHNWFGALVACLVLLLTYYVHPYLKHPAEVMSGWIQTYTFIDADGRQVIGTGLLHNAMTLLVSLLFTLSLSSALPYIFYAQHTTAMRALGLAGVFEQSDAIQGILQRYVSMAGNEGRIRIICISGRQLFREVAGKSAPLQKAAMEGRLDVIMPISDETSITIRERFDTYLDPFKDATYPEGVSGLVREIGASKTFLAKHATNTVHEHNTLCMWRVVLFKNHCVVQNYFPNPAGAASDGAPLFVFENIGPGSYYRTFETMFNLLSKNSLKATPTP
ncbi:MAG: hypothetical protein ABL962_12485 [Fimbriimonadaceae bacterium]